MLGTGLSVADGSRLITLPCARLALADLAMLVATVVVVAAAVATVVVAELLLLLSSFEPRGSPARSGGGAWSICLHEAA